MSAFEVRVEDERGELVSLKLATDDKGRPIFRTETTNPLQPSVQVGEASYGSFDPRTQGVFAQGDLSGGMGSKTQKAASDKDAKRYYYAEWCDPSVAGQIQKGYAVTTEAAPANSGTLLGYFELGSTPYLVLSRIIASYSGGVLTQARDLGASGVASSGATYYQLAAAASVESNTGDTAQDDLASADHRIAQQFRVTAAGVKFLSRVNCKLIVTGTPASITGDVRLVVQSDHSGSPSGNTLATARLLAKNLTTSGVVYGFRFDDDEQIAVTNQDPLWLVLDSSGSDGTNKVGWRRDGTSGYSRGLSLTSTDAGNSWTTAGGDHYFEVYAKAATETAFVGADDGTNTLATTTDGTSYTADSYRIASQLAVVSGKLVRDVRGTGVIQWSADGTNWSESIPVGDVTTSINALLRLGEVCLICKTDGLWAADMASATEASPPTVQQLYGVDPVSTNGQGACVYKAAAFIPLNGKLVAVEGDFSTGFTVTHSVGLEALPEWDAPWGAGRHVACAATLDALYSVVSATGGYRLVKASDPINKLDWHGSLCTIGDGTQTVRFAAIHEPGGTSNPTLFVTTTSNDVAAIVLPRGGNPAADAGNGSFLYDITTAADLYHPRATGQFPAHDKAWLKETVTFQARSASDYVDTLYDTLDGEGWRRFENGRAYDTRVLDYPAITSRVLARRTRIVTSVQTSSPQVMSSALTYAVRAQVQRLSFAVDAEDGLSADSLGSALGVTGDTQATALLDGTRGATRRLITPQDKTVTVLLLAVRDALLERHTADRARRVVEVEAILV